METKKNNRLEEFINNPVKGLYKMAVPVLFGMLIHATYHIVDMIFVGRISSSAIAALGFNIPIIFFIYGIAVGLGSGVTAIIAKHIGSRDDEAAANTAEHGLILALFFGLILSLVGIFFNKQILLFLNVPLQLLDRSSAYLHILSYSFISVSCYVIFRSIFTGEGNTKTPMIILSMGTILNIILDPIFIFSLDMGLSGAALATTISEFLVFLTFIYVVFIRKMTYLRLNIKSFRFKWKISTNILRIGLPASLSMIIISSGMGIFNSILVHFNPNAVAAYQIVRQVEQIYFIPVLSVAVAIVTLTGMFYGAGQVALLTKIIKLGTFINILWGVFCGILFYLIAPEVFYIFSRDSEVSKIALSYVKVIMFTYPLISIGITNGRILQGLGSSLPMLTITATRVAGVAAPLAYVFVIILSKPVEWVWYSMAAATLCSVGISILWLKSRIYKIKIELSAAQTISL